MGKHQQKSMKQDWLQGTDSRDTQHAERACRVERKNTTLTKDHYPHNRQHAPQHGCKER